MTKWTAYLYSTIKMTDSENSVFEYLYHAMELNPENGLQLWSATFDKFQESWQIDTCRRLLREIKQTSQLQEFRPEVQLLVRSAEGMLEVQLGHWQAAEVAHQKAIKQIRQTGNKTVEAMLLTNLGNVYYLARQLPMATTYFSQALAIYETNNDKQGMALTLSNLGNIYRDNGQLDKAFASYQASLKWQRQHSGRTDLEAITLTNLATVLQTQGKWDEAEKTYLAAFALFIDLDDLYHQSQVLGNLGTLCLQTNRYEQALPYFLKDLEMAQRINNHASQSHTLNNLGIVYRHLEQETDAFQCYQQSLVLKQELGDLHGELTVLINICRLLQLYGDQEIIDLFWQRTDALAESLGQTERLAEIGKLEIDDCQ